MEGTLSLLSIVEPCFQLYASVDPGLLCNICLSRGKAVRCVPLFFLLFCLCFFLNLGIAITMDDMLSKNQVSACSVMELHAGQFRRLKAFYTSSCLGILISQYSSLPCISFS